MSGLFLVILVIAGCIVLRGVGDVFVKDCRYDDLTSSFLKTQRAAMYFSGIAAQQSNSCRSGRPIS